MSIQVLRCPNCGADLDVGDGVETIRCRFCGARCHVEGYGASQHLTLISEQLQRLEGHASRTAEELAALRQQHEHGLNSRIVADEAMRRAAAAHEEAAQEAAYAARLQSATHEAFASASRDWAMQQEAERLLVLALRSRYRMWRIVAVATFPIVWLVSGVIGLAFLFAEPGWTTVLGLILSLPVAPVVFSSIAWRMGTLYGRRYNAKAFLHGLPEVRVKSAAEEQWENESKRIDKKWKNAMRSPSERAVVVLAPILIVGVIAFAWHHSTKQDDSPASGNMDGVPKESKPAIEPSNDPSKSSGLLEGTNNGQLGPDTPNEGTHEQHESRPKMDASESNHQAEQPDEKGSKDMTD